MHISTMYSPLQSALISLLITVHIIGYDVVAELCRMMELIVRLKNSAGA